MSLIDENIEFGFEFYFIFVYPHNWIEIASWNWKKENQKSK